MDLSHFLAKVIGLYLIIGALLVVFKQANFRQMINEYFDSPALVMIGGAISLILGLLMIVSHSVWEANWKLLVTLMGYLTFLKGISHWFFPEKAALLATKTAGGRLNLFASVIMVALGLYLTYVGFLH